MQKLLMTGILDVPPIMKEDKLVIDVTVIDTPACFIARDSLSLTGFPLSSNERLSKACGKYSNSCLSLNPIDIRRK